MEKQGVFVIAEAGVNHNGSLDIGLELVDRAAEAGADAVKFQTFKAASCISESAPKAEYQKETAGTAESQLEMVRKLELDERQHQALWQRCRERGIEYMSTAFDMDSLASLLRLQPKRLKISSGEVESAPLMLAAARSGLPILLSTGVCGLADIEIALGVLAFGYLGIGEKPTSRRFAMAYASPEGRRALKEKVTLLHCTTEYPSPLEDANLRAMATMRTAFDLSVGCSDHSLGLIVPIAATALGAAVIEKHFTLDRSLSGPDHHASVEPDGLKEMVRGIRAAESALGSGVKVPAPSEQKNLDIIRKSLVAGRPIKAGEPFTEANLAWKRPAGGISPLHYWEYLGKTAAKDYEMDEMVTE